MARQTGPQPTLTESYMRQAVRMLTLIGVLLLIAFCFFASSICIAIVLAAFLALLADPAVQVLERFGIPRFVAAGLVVLVGALAMTLLAYGAYAKSAEFSDNFEIYANRIHELGAPISSRVEHVRESAGRTGSRDGVQGSAGPAYSGVAILDNLSRAGSRIDGRSPGDWRRSFLPGVFHAAGTGETLGSVQSAGRHQTGHRCLA